MDLENQKRVKEAAEKYSPENLVVILGASEAESAGLAAETVTAGDPTFAGPLAGVELGLAVYHVVEEEMKELFDEDVYESAGLAAETVTAGDPTFAGPLAGVELGLAVYHVVEEEMKELFDEDVYEDQIGMMEMVLDVDEIAEEIKGIREENSKY